MKKIRARYVRFVEPSGLQYLPETSLNDIGRSLTGTQAWRRNYLNLPKQDRASIIMQAASQLAIGKDKIAFAKKRDGSWTLLSEGEEEQWDSLGASSSSYERYEQDLHNDVINIRWINRQKNSVEISQRKLYENLYKAIIGKQSGEYDAEDIKISKANTRKLIKNIVGYKTDQQKETYRRLYKAIDNLVYKHPDSRITQDMFNGGRKEFYSLYSINDFDLSLIKANEEIKRTTTKTARLKKQYELVDKYTLNIGFTKRVKNWGKFDKAFKKDSEQAISSLYDFPKDMTKWNKTLSEAFRYDFNKNKITLNGLDKKAALRKTADVVFDPRRGMTKKLLRDFGQQIAKTFVRNIEETAEFMEAIVEAFIV